MGYYSDMMIRILETRPEHGEKCQCWECRQDREAGRRLARMEFPKRAEAAQKPSEIRFSSEWDH